MEVNPAAVFEDSGSCWCCICQQQQILTALLLHTVLLSLVFVLLLNKQPPQMTLCLFRQPHAACEQLWTWSYTAHTRIHIPLWVSLIAE